MNTRPLMASREEMIATSDFQRPHVVILGAGASRAACVNGDKNGQRLPLMCDLVEIVGLKELLAGAGVAHLSENFEALYSSLHSDPSRASLVTGIESAVHDYFSSLTLPDIPTVYDHLVLSLREKDAIFSFDWDPFLYDAWIRNRRLPGPQIYFLHGNVRVAYCPRHIQHFGAPWDYCPECDKQLVRTKLLYPVTSKSYSDLFIADQWETAKLRLKHAFALTIFGYGAPASDVGAVDMMRLAWRTQGDRLFERVEVIDIKNQEELHETWEPFAFHHYCDYRESFYDSWVARYPRRSCEALREFTTCGRPVDPFPIPRHFDFRDLYDELTPFAQLESPQVT